MSTIARCVLEELRGLEALVRGLEEVLLGFWQFSSVLQSLNIRLEVQR